MTAVELTVLTNHYRTKLAQYDAIDFGTVADGQFLDRLAEASSLRKILHDFQDEGYDSLVTAIATQTNAFERLEQFIAQSLDQLDIASEAEHFYLYPDVVQIAGLDDVQFDDGPCFELTDYLERLDQLANTPKDITHCFETHDEQRRWEAKTHVLMSEMVDFLAYVVGKLEQTPDATPVMLLRDTLLIHFGLKWMKQQGADFPEPKPIFLSRKFTNAFEPDEAIYVKLSSDILYGILHNNPNVDVATLRQQFVAQASLAYPESHPFVKASRDYLDRLGVDGSMLVIESGLHGTFPLWLLRLTDNVGAFVLYTTAPWLYTTYSDVVFRKNYNYLRDTETITVHDLLFQLKSLKNGQLTVQETVNPLATSLAHYELHLFKQLVQQEMKELHPS